MSARRIPLAARALRKIQPQPDGCWLWTANIAPHGYGRIRSDGGGPQVYAHRVVYEALVGPIPEGLTLDHLCRNRSCVNPNHLEPVTISTNVKRGGNAIKTHCKRGHEFTEENTYRWRNARKCRICRDAAEARRVRQ